MRTAFSIFQSIVTVLACVVLLAGATCFILGMRPAIVMSGSMEPEISAGSLCIYDTKADYEDIRKGDIIAFRSGDLCVTHRVVKVMDIGYVTKGDANKVRDGGVVTGKGYLGRTVLWIPGLGKVVAFFKTAYGMILLGMIVLFMIVASVILGKKDSGEEGSGEEGSGSEITCEEFTQ